MRSLNLVSAHGGEQGSLGGISQQMNDWDHLPPKGLKKGSATQADHRGDAFSSGPKGDCDMFILSPDEISH